MKTAVFTILIATALSAPVFAQSGADFMEPVYPKTHACSPIKSLFKDLFDLDGTRRPEPHVGIDLGLAGDQVIAPADGEIVAIWPVDHAWGRDWNVLLRHTSKDLNLDDASVVYVTEYDHLQDRDMAHLKAGDRLKRGDQIGIVGHPGDNTAFASEIHMEILEMPIDRENDTEWRDENGLRYWHNASAELIDPLYMMSLDGNRTQDGKAEIVPFDPSRNFASFKGMTYPLACAKR